MWDFLDKFNSITGFFLFFTTLANLFISWKINTKIHSAVDLQRLKVSKDKEIGTLKSIIRKLDVDEKISNESKLNILKCLTDIRATYPDIKKLNQKDFFKKIESDKLDYLKTREKLRRLITEIERLV
ncbi:hypothetical protein [Enterococcus casseliflavus]|uniref:hypothetical protein n=1 Tax=Enterococcus casseliflavus TaxID=37734 RepID=UPI003DA386E7